MARNRSLDDAVDAFLRRTRLSHADWARQVGITRQRLHQILRGESLPSLVLAIRLEDTSGIPIRLFASADDRRVRR